MEINVLEGSLMQKSLMERSFMEIGVKQMHSIGRNYCRRSQC